MEVWTGFVVGLLGSLHCVGMCGPIVAALPQGEGGKLSFLYGRLLYNCGRVITYALIGLVFGLIGKTIFMAGYQQGLSIAIGVVIILAVITPSRYSQGLIAALGLGKVYTMDQQVVGSPVSFEQEIIALCHWPSERFSAVRICLCCSGGCGRDRRGAEGIGVYGAVWSRHDTDTTRILADRQCNRAEVPPRFQPCRPCAGNRAGAGFYPARVIVGCSDSKSEDDAGSGDWRSQVILL